MTPEEMERAIHFIINQQAQFVTDIQQVREVQAQFATDLQAMRAVQAEFQTQLGKVTDATLTLIGLVGRVTEAQVRTEQRLVETNDRLNTFIVTVERYINEHNGNEGS